MPKSAKPAATKGYGKHKAGVGDSRNQKSGTSRKNGTSEQPQQQAVNKITSNGVSRELKEKAVDNSRKLKNGIPENPNCHWGKRKLAHFYHNILLPEIDNLGSAARGARDTYADGGDDGGNGGDELFSNSKANNVAETFEVIREQEFGHNAKRDFFLEIKRQIDKGIFVCKCKFEVFYQKRIL